MGYGHSNRPITHDRAGVRGDRTTPDHALLERLAGTDCPFCEGSVAPGEYKGNTAAVCDVCGTPPGQLF